VRSASDASASNDRDRIASQDAARDAGDAELAARLSSGEPAAFEEIDRRYRARLRAFATRRLPDPHDAEDVAQEVLLETFRSIDRYEGRARLETWMFGIAFRVVGKRLRSRRRYEIPLEVAGADRLAARASCLDELLDARRKLDRCDAVLRKHVSGSQQQVFRMRYEGNHSVRSIADHLGKSQDAVKVGLHRTRQRLARSLEEVSPPAK
jgi:RNA polymerase sigma-70 factor (ECF subfamily)